MLKNRCRASCGRSANDKRGLCRRCYRTPDVRILFPRLRETVPGGRFDVQEESYDVWEPTDAEVEATIAEQSKSENLPPWWEHEVVKQDAQGRVTALEWLLVRRRV